MKTPIQNCRAKLEKTFVFHEGLYNHMKLEPERAIRHDMPTNDGPIIQPQSNARQLTSSNGPHPRSRRHARDFCKI